MYLHILGKIAPSVLFKSSTYADRLQDGNSIYRVFLWVVSVFSSFLPQCERTLTVLI